VKEEPQNILAEVRSGTDGDLFDQLSMMKMAEDIERRLEEAIERGEPSAIQSIIDNFSQDMADAQIMAQAIQDETITKSE